MPSERPDDMEELAEMLAYRLPLWNRRDGARETCIRLTSVSRDGVRAELVVRKDFVRLNLSEAPDAEALRVAGLEPKALVDGRFAWATEVRPKDGLGARLLLEAATSAQSGGRPTLDT